MKTSSNIALLERAASDFQYKETERHPESVQISRQFKTQIVKLEKIEFVSIHEMRKWKKEEPSLILMWQYDHDQNALLTLINRYGPFIYSQIRKHINARPNCRHDREELYQHAVLALITAVSRFDFTKNARLSTYAKIYIKNSISQYALDFQYPYRIGTSSDERKAIYAALNRKKKKEKYSQHSPLNQSDFTWIKKKTRANDKIVKDAIQCIGHSVCSVETIKNTANASTTHEDVETLLSREKAFEILESLSSRYKSKKDIKKYTVYTQLIKYGDVNIEELAKLFDVTEERVRQIRKQIRNDMKSILVKNKITPSELSL